MAQMVFARFETKYILNRAQYEALLPALKGKTMPDKYGAYSINNIYYDTEQYDLIRASIEKPVYKEKLRLRCYGRADADTKVFLELKKKFRKRVYKRRIALPYAEAQGFPFGNSWERICGGLASQNDKAAACSDLQVAGEIGQFLRLHPVEPKVYLRYDRLALSGAEDPDLRITFDSGIRFRQDDCRLDGDGTGGMDCDYDAPVLEPAKVLMEVKTAFSIPLWLSHLLSEHAIFPVSFSKYGTCYQNFIRNQDLSFFQEQLTA
ncbi:molecular chaperone [Spirochaetia bacterium]|nr:molecular chaperone [Spirochaetia bacterium]